MTHSLARVKDGDRLLDQSIFSARERYKLLLDQDKENPQRPEENVNFKRKEFSLPDTDWAGKNRQSVPSMLNLRFNGCSSQSYTSPNKPNNFNSEEGDKEKEKGSRESTCPR
jgi:hypothetical protein